MKSTMPLTEYVIKKWKESPKHKDENGYEYIEWTREEPVLGCAGNCEYEFVYIGQLPCKNCAGIRWDTEEQRYYMKPLKEVLKLWSREVLECPECGGEMFKSWTDEYGRYEWHCYASDCIYWEVDEEN